MGAGTRTALRAAGAVVSASRGGVKTRPYVLDGPGILITGLPCSGKSLLWEMLKHTLYRHAFDDSDCAGIRQGVVSRFCSAVFVWPQFQSTRNCIVMIRDPRDILGQRNESGEYVISAHSSTIKGSRDCGLVEWWRAIKTLKGALLLRFEHLIERPDAIQERLGWRLGIDYQSGRRFSDIKPREATEALSQEQLHRVDSEIESSPELLDVFAEMGYPYQADRRDAA